jgi:hypothetical protein
VLLSRLFQAETEGRQDLETVGFCLVRFDLILQPPPDVTLNQLQRMMSAVSWL